MFAPETEEGIRGNAKLYHTDPARKGEKWRENRAGECDNKRVEVEDRP
jgi:hypothetical protein